MRRRKTTAAGAGLHRDLEAAPTLPQQSPERDGPDAGYGPGALAQKPTARQPGGNRALNAPNRTSAAGQTRTWRTRNAPQRKGSKQFTYGWGDLEAVIDLCWRDAWMHEMRGRGGQWSTGSMARVRPVVPRSRSRTARTSAAALTTAAAPTTWTRWPGGQRTATPMSSGWSPGRAPRTPPATTRRASRLWQQASDLAEQKIQEYKDHEALSSFKQTPWDKAHPGQVAARRRVESEDPISTPGSGTYGGEEPNDISYGGGGGTDSGGMDELANDYRFSAETGRLAVTPAPYGKPGGPGLYHVKGLRHSAYLEQIVHALMTQAGHGQGPGNRDCPRLDPQVDGQEQAPGSAGCGRRGGG